jgi:hypothetical protein
MGVLEMHKGFVRILEWVVLEMQKDLMCVYT